MSSAPEASATPPPLPHAAPIRKYFAIKSGRVNAAFAFGNSRFPSHTVVAPGTSSFATTMTICVASATPVNVQRIVSTPFAPTLRS